MLIDGIIEPSNSPYCSPVVIVTRKNGKPRFCVDYRRLNAITIDTSQELPHIQDTLKDLGNARVFSTIDLRNGYWQVRMEEQSKKYTAFTLPQGGTYQFKVMPFGLKNAPSTFQRLMSQIFLVGYINKFCMVYLDDIIIYSQTWSDHLQHVGLILERLKLHDLKCSLEKSRFGKTTTDFLGHIVTAEANFPQEVHVNAILEATTPHSKKALQKFLGICGWIQEYVPHFSDTAAPLTNLLGKQSRRWTWNPTAEKAFQDIKTLFRAPL